jgi:hypothetical protein
MRNNNVFSSRSLLSAALVALILYRSALTVSGDPAPRADGELRAEYVTDRSHCLRVVSRRLFIITAFILLLTVLVFVLPLIGERFFVSWFCFGVAVLGGFVSVQQRLKTVSDEELHLLSTSWGQVILYPLVAGIFGLLVYVLTMSGLIQGALFPNYSIPNFPARVTDATFRSFLLTTYPASGEDFAKLVIWTFIAGFSERFVPDVLDGLAKRKISSE